MTMLRMEGWLVEGIMVTVQVWRNHQIPMGCFRVLAVVVHRFTGYVSYCIMRPSNRMASLWFRFSMAFGPCNLALTCPRIQTVRYSCHQHCAFTINVVLLLEPNHL